MDSINIFYTISTKGDNDSSNKQREKIIADVINGKIPVEYLDDRRWANFVTSLLQALGNPTTCEQKAGRGHHHDMVIDGRQKVELKFNAESPSDAPQFVSPGRPSKYLRGMPYEEAHYDKVIPQLSQKLGIDPPPKEEYLKKVHNCNPECMKEFKQAYKNNKEFQTFAKQTTKTHLAAYVKNTELDLPALSEYLLKTQDGKLYLLYKNGDFRTEVIHPDNYKLTKCIAVTHNTYIVETAAGTQLAILLRWKNGNGIAYPAFQIKLLKGKAPARSEEPCIRSSSTKLLERVLRRIESKNLTEYALVRAIKDELSRRITQKLGNMVV